MTDFVFVSFYVEMEGKVILCDYNCCAKYSLDLSSPSDARLSELSLVFIVKMLMFCVLSNCRNVEYFTELEDLLMFY